MYLIPQENPPMIYMEASQSGFRLFNTRKNNLTIEILRREINDKSCERPTIYDTPKIVKYVEHTQRHSVELRLESSSFSIHYFCNYARYKWWLPFMRLKVKSIKLVDENMVSEI
jgi:hypothetical protein